jgi:DNA-binding response OmpR family regulator
MAKILIVDDDPDIIESTKLILEAEGYEVFSAFNRREGMKAMPKKPDLLILDVMMEEADDGIVMARELRRSGVKIPILMLSAISRVTRMNYDRDSDLLPVEAFVEKPVSPNTLLLMVRKLLEQAKERERHADHRA